MQIGTRVSFQSHVQSGTGVITDIKHGPKGDYYVVTKDADKKTISMRAARLTII